MIWSTVVIFYYLLRMTCVPSTNDGPYDVLLVVSSFSVCIIINSLILLPSFA